MKLIEPYVSMYVMHCLFPNSELPEYVYDVLSESTSRPQNIILSSVLDVIRQDDPQKPGMKDDVRNYILELLGAQKEEAPEYRALYSVREGMAIFTIHRRAETIGLTFAPIEHIPEACRLLETQFPGIRITQVS